MIYPRLHRLAVVCIGLLNVSMMTRLGTTGETATLPHERSQDIPRAEQYLARCAPRGLGTLSTQPLNGMSSWDAYDTEPSSWIDPGLESLPNDASYWGFILQSPPGPIQVDAHFLHNGEPIRLSRERWIDAALSGESPTKTSTAESSEAQRHAIIERLRDFSQRQATPLSRAACRHLLARWLNGPPVIVARPIADPRGSRMPLWQFADQDRNGVLDSDEQGTLVRNLGRLDRDGNRSIALIDLQRAVRQQDTSSPSARDVADKGRVRLAWQQKTVRLLGPSTEPIASPVIARLECVVDWHSDEKPSVLMLTAFASSDATAGEPIAAGDDAIMVRIKNCHLELSFVLQNQTNMTRVDRQFSIGAELDGYPLWRLVDTDGDRRLTSTETERLPATLAKLDINRDQHVDSTELPIPMRLVFGAGPSAHLALAYASMPALMEPTNRVEVSPEAPPWFRSMDANHDGNLDRTEFLGTDEQFTHFDNNNDKQLNATEVRGSGK